MRGGYASSPGCGGAPGGAPGGLPPTKPRRGHQLPPTWPQGARGERGKLPSRAGGFGVLNISSSAPAWAVRLCTHGLITAAVLGCRTARVRASVSPVRGPPNTALARTDASTLLKLSFKLVSSNLFFTLPAHGLSTRALFLPSPPTPLLLVPRRQKCVVGSHLPKEGKGEIPLHVWHSLITFATSRDTLFPVVTAIGLPA